MGTEVEALTAIRERAERRVDAHQRRIEWFTAQIGRPRTLYLVVGGVLAWLAINLAMLAAKVEPLDPPPFLWLQGVVGLCALLTSTLVLITANRQTRDAEERSHLDLQVNLLAEQKVAKLIALVEELRRDLPIVRDRVDREAEEMKEAVDPEAVLEALEKPLEP
jgi:uncharacterized membrane protein